MKETEHEPPASVQLPELKVPLPLRENVTAPVGVDGFLLVSETVTAQVVGTPTVAGPQVTVVVVIRGGAASAVEPKASALDQARISAITSARIRPGAGLMRPKCGRIAHVAA